MWFCIENLGNRLEDLIKAKVPIVEMSIERPRHLRVIAFPEEELGRVIEILGLSIAPESKSETDQEELFLLEVGGESCSSRFKPTVTVESWNGENQRGFVKITQEILAPVVGKVVIHVPHGKTAAPIRDGQFHIFFWSSLPNQKRNQETPATIWGIKVDCRDEGFSSSGQGIPILDIDNGWAVGELVDNTNLFIHHDLCHCGTVQELEIFRLLCQKVVELILPVEEKSKWEKEELERHRKAYIRECNRRLKKALEETKIALEDLLKRQEEYSKALVEAIREEVILRKKLEQLAEVEKNQTVEFGREFDRLLAIPKIKAIKVMDGVISVFTECLYTHPLRDGTIRELGEYRIDIPTSGGIPKIYNLTRRIDGHDHPHQQDDGSPCLGNIKEGIVKLISAYEYSVVAQIMIQFLETINEDDSYGKRIYNWPIKKDKK